MIDNLIFLPLERKAARQQNGTFQKQKSEAYNSMAKEAILKEKHSNPSKFHVKLKHWYFLSLERERRSF